MTSGQELGIITSRGCCLPGTVVEGALVGGGRGITVPFVGVELVRHVEVSGGWGRRPEAEDVDGVEATC